MNEATTKTCEKILKSLLDIPISGVLWEYKPELLGESERLPFYFENVALKLNKNLYNSPDQFIYDVRTIFESAQTEKKKKTIYHISSTILEIEFKRLLDENSFEGSQLVQKEKEIDDLFVLCNKNYTEKTPKITLNEEVEAGASILNRDPSTFSADDLSHLISVLQSPDAIVAVAAELKKLQPECISLDENELVFHFCLMNEETIHALSKTAIEEGKKSAKVLNK